MKEIEYYSVQQVAGILGITRQRVWQKINRGKIKAVRIGRAWVVHKNDITLPKN